MTMRTTTTKAGGTAVTSRGDGEEASVGAVAASSPSIGKGAVPAAEPAQPRPAGPAARAPRAGGSKVDQIRAMLAAPEGASLSALCDATGWQTHSVRAALTGLRKAGAAIEKAKNEDGVTVYRIAADLEQSR